MTDWLLISYKAIFVIACILAVGSRLIERHHQSARRVPRLPLEDLFHEADHDDFSPADDRFARVGARSSRGHR